MPTATRAQLNPLPVHIVSCTVTNSTPLLTASGASVNAENGCIDVVVAAGLLSKSNLLANQVVKSIRNHPMVTHPTIESPH